MCSLFIKQICVIFFCVSRAASLQFGVIFMHVNTRIIFFSRRELQLYDDATNWEEENEYTRGKGGIKIIIKTHTHCQGRRSLNVVRIIIIASQKTATVCVGASRRDEMCTSRKKYLNFQIKSKFIRNSTNATKKVLSIRRPHNNSSDSPFDGRG